MKPHKFEYCRPKTTDDAVRLLGETGGEGRLLAGGQSLVPMLNFRLAAPGALVDVSQVSELCAAERTSDGIRYGASVTHAQIEDAAVPDVSGGLLQHVAGQIAYRAVRNRGTLGGSLAHADPAGDWAPVMIALDATILVAGPGGARTVQASELIPDVMSTVLDDEEMIVGIEIRELPAAASWGHYKITRQPGHFGDAIAVVIRDPGRERTRVALALKRLPPVLLPETLDLLNELGSWAAATYETVKVAVTRDLAALEIDCDSYEKAIHPAAVARAAQKAFGA